jgi:hypothetical protein
MKNEYDKMSTPDLIGVVRSLTTSSCLLKALADRLERSVGAFEDVSGKMVDFMARAAEAENAADELEKAITTVRGDIHSPGMWEAIEAALAELDEAKQWRNGEALNRHKLALKEIRRAVVSVKRDYDVSEARPDILEVDKDTLMTLFKIVNAHTKEENT